MVYDDLDLSEEDLRLVDEMLFAITANLRTLSFKIDSVGNDLSGLDLSFNTSGILNLINNAIDGAYDGNGLIQLQENVKTTRIMLDDMSITNAFTNLFDFLDNNPGEINLTDLLGVLEHSRIKYFFDDPDSPEYKEYAETIMRYYEVLSKGSLNGADLYKLSDTIDVDVEKIRSDYPPREAAVYLALYQLGMAVNRPNGVATVKYENATQLIGPGGIRQPVPNKYIFGYNGLGGDCNGVLSWCLFRDGWLAAEEYYNIDLIGKEISFFDAKPGDYFVTNQANNSHQPHVGLILYNDPVNRKVYTFEARDGSHRGISLYVRDYLEDGTMVNEYNVRLLCVDPEKLFTEGNMSHFPFTNVYGGNNK